MLNGIFIRCFSPSAYRIDKEAEVKVSFLFLAQPNSSNAYSSRDDDG